jgi:hypothetical protein
MKNLAAVILIRSPPRLRCRVHGHVAFSKRRSCLDDPSRSGHQVSDIDTAARQSLWINIIDVGRERWSFARTSLDCQIVGLDSICWQTSQLNHGLRYAVLCGSQFTWEPSCRTDALVCSQAPTQPKIPLGWRGEGFDEHTHDPWQDIYR